MATSVPYNGTTYSVPSTGERNWGGTTKVDGLLIALAGNVLQKSGGNFTLQSDVDWGNIAGHKALYYRSRSASASSSGVFRLSNSEFIGWRNAANDGDVLLSVDSGNKLLFNGDQLFTSSGLLVASRMVVTDASAQLITNAVTATEAGYLSGVTSALQTQLNAKISASSTDVLTNKTLSDSTVLFANVSDATKKLQFALAGITTGTTRIVTWPDSDMTVVGLTLTQTLTNKTLTSPTVNTPTINTATINGVKKAISATKTSSYSALVTDSVIRVDATGGAFTVTLPAVGSTGQTFKIKKILTDVSFGVVTITDGGATLTTTINTAGEEVEVFDNGTAWVVESRYSNSASTSFTGAWTAVSVNPSIGNGVLSANWRRVGDTAEITYLITMGGTTSFGTGEWIFGLPSGMSIDTTKLQQSSANNTIIGHGGAVQGAYHSVIALYDTTGQFRAAADNAAGRITSASPETWASGQTLKITAIVPISGWKA